MYLNVEGGYIKIKGVVFMREVFICLLAFLHNKSVNIQGDRSIFVKFLS